MSYYDLKKIFPVVLAGGSGERLWPVSRFLYPKPFLSFDKQDSLFQKTISRLQDLENVTIIGNEKHRILLKRQLNEINYNNADIILEPVAKNTAPSLTIACMKILRDQGDSIVLLAPSDHIIFNSEKFYDDIYRGYKYAQDGNVVLFSIKPKSPDTQFGYIKVKNNDIDLCEDISLVEDFIEKPSIESAKSFFKSGIHYWNSGILMLKASVWINLIKSFRPEIENYCKKSLENGNFEDGFLYLDKNNFKNISPESIDYAVLELLPKHNLKDPFLPSCFVVSLSSEWLDLGSWDSIHDFADKNQDGNLLDGDVVAIDSKDSIVMSRNKLLVSLGLQNIVFIDSKDATIVSSFEKLDQLKSVVGLLKSEDRKEVNSPIYVEEKWGSYEIIHESDDMICKKFLLNPGFSIPLDLLRLVLKKCIGINGKVEIEMCNKIFELLPFDVFEIQSNLSCKITNNSDQIFVGIIIFKN